jgi:hypothetical protein
LQAEHLAKKINRKAHKVFRKAHKAKTQSLATIKTAGFNRNSIATFA